MSATFKLAAKKKYTQNDLRRLMQEQRSKSKVSVTPSAETSRIESPLAKYNEAGQLTCVLCKSVVRSESVWKVHINTKAHKENVDAAKALKDKLQNINQKRAAPQNIKSEIPIKKPKSILKNSIKTDSESSSIQNGQNNPFPKDFFDTKQKFVDSVLNKNSKPDLKINVAGTSAEKMEIEEQEQSDDKLPEGFFDDPIKDAKVHNKEYKDPQEEEWERFQKEIKEQAVVSNEIIAGEQEDSTAKRQIEEIDEQIRQWSKVLNLEKKKENVLDLKTKITKNTKTNNEASDEDESMDEEDFDEFLDWRAKRLK